MAAPYQSDNTYWSKHEFKLEQFVELFCFITEQVPGERDGLRVRVSQDIL
jgi:hypothetical protein